MRHTQTVMTQMACRIICLHVLLKYEEWKKLCNLVDQNVPSVYKYTYTNIVDSYETSNNLVSGQGLHALLKNL